MANIITGIRILVSMAMLFSTAFSPVFFVFYIVGGLSDILDGAVARKTNTVSHFGSRFDSFADMVFVVVCLIKMFPVIDIPKWIYLWIAIIAAIKITNIVLVLINHKKLISVHSFLNKTTGALCFLFPLTLPFIDMKNITLLASLICLLATIAAIHECHLVKRSISI